MSKRDPRKSTIVADNYNRNVLEFCKDQLETLKIHSTIYLAKKKGTKVLIRGAEYHYNNDLYRISIHRRASVARFAKEVGFSILRKQEKLKTFLQVYYSSATENTYNRTQKHSGGRI